MGETTGRKKQRSVTLFQACFGKFQRHTSSKSEIDTTGVTTGQGKQPETENLEDPLNTTKTNLAGRRLRSDSPTEDGAFESQPLKRQNSMGEVEPPHMGSNGPRNHSNSPPSDNTAATTLQQPQQQLKQHQADTTSQPAAILEKSSTFPPSRAEGRTRKSQETPQNVLPPVGSECPPYGSKSVIGRRAKMEDAFKAVPNLFQVDLHREADELLPPRLAPQLRSNSSSSRGSAETAAAAASVPQRIGTVSENHAVSTTTTESAFTTHTGPTGLTINPADQSSIEVLHFFGVFDGHGGADAAMHCAKTLHERVKQVLSAITSPLGLLRNADGGTEAQQQPATAGKDEEAKKSTEMEAAEEGVSGVQGSCTTSQPAGTDAPLSSAFESGSSDIDFMDAEDTQASTGGAGADGNGGDVITRGATTGRLSHAASIEGLACTTETVEAALTKAFHLTDEEFGEMGGYEHLALVGTTAVVALIGSRMIYVANCGDSRAVLCRNGQAIALTDDHKAAREDETARVEAAGGQILFWNGVRVMGLLAVSRAIGDHSLRPYVIAEPEVTIVNRNPDDEVLIMASDGLWDVMSNQEACNLAKKCLLRARQRGSTRHSAAKVAATVLTRAAVDRGSRDNVTVVIVDLTNRLEGDAEGERDDISAPLPSKLSKESSENLSSPTWRDATTPSGDGIEEEMPTAPAALSGADGAMPPGPPAPPSPFDVPVTTSEGGATTQSNPQNLTRRVSNPLPSPFSTD